jgi:predicted molibdopterin-dependent oxidoreductase YjgC
MKKLSAEAALEVVYEERELTPTQKILMSPDRSPNFRGARDMGVLSNGGFGALVERLVAGELRSAYVVGEDLVADHESSGALREALKNLSFLVVQDIRLTETARLAHVVLPATHFGEKTGTYTNREGRVQKLDAAVIAPEGPLQDNDIFLRLLELSGEKLAGKTPSEIFDVLAKEFSAYQELSHAALGDQGVLLGGGVAK